MLFQQQLQQSQDKCQLMLLSKALHKSKQLQVGTASGPVIIGPLKQKLNDDILPTNIFYFNATIHTVLLYAERNRDMMLSPQMLDLESNEMLLGLYSYKTVDHTCVKRFDYGDLQWADFNGCSRHYDWKQVHPYKYQKIDGGFVHLEEGSPKKGKNYGKEIQCSFSLRLNVCLSPDFSYLWKVKVWFYSSPGHDNMYSFDLKNVVPLGGLTCLFAKTTIDESNLWFSWVFFLATKDETSRILKTFITGIENKINHKVKIIRCDNGTEFKNNDMNQFYGMKGIKREFSVARTPQQNRVAERKNRTLIEAARTMLSYSLLPTTFWAEAVNTACYVENRVLVTKYNTLCFQVIDDVNKSAMYLLYCTHLLEIINVKLNR
ncbi:putative ribonuclease H-like domain-containing protein, partial [Tanacetum coccineum]